MSTHISQRCPDAAPPVVALSPPLHHRRHGGQLAAHSSSPLSRVSHSQRIPFICAGTANTSGAMHMHTHGHTRRAQAHARTHALLRLPRTRVRWANFKANPCVNHYIIRRERGNERLVSSERCVCLFNVGGSWTITACERVIFNLLLDVRVQHLYSTFVALCLHTRRTDL